MTVFNSNSHLKVFTSATALFHAAAQDFTERTQHCVQEKGTCNVVLSGGNTPKNFFNVLTENSQYKDHIPWNNIRFFFSDERYVPSTDPQSNYHTAQQLLFTKLAIPAANIYRVPTELATAAAAAQQYDATLRTLFHLQTSQWPPFDITFLGMGSDGHTASLMPFTELVSSYLQGKPPTDLVAAEWIEALKMYRITLTPPAINHSVHTVFLVEGAEKAEALNAVLEGQSDPLRYPAQLIQGAVWYVDQAATSQLKNITHEKLR